MNNLFSEFQTADKATWLSKVEADLKGKKTLEELNWNISEELSISPFAAEEDIQGIDHSVLKEYNPDWQIGEQIIVEDYKAANERVLDILMEGVTAPNFHLLKTPNETEFEALFENVGVEFIATHFSFAENVNGKAVYQLWKNLLQKRELSSTFGCFEFPFNVADLVGIVKENNDFASETVHVNCSEFCKGDENVLEELKQSIALAKKQIDALIEEGIEAQQIVQQTFFTVCVGKSYLLEIAKLRALKLLWVDLLKSYDLEPSLPFIKVKFASTAYGENKHDNLINASTLAMSAVCGGATHLLVNPDFSQDEKTSNTEYRLARNVQLILKHESGFHEVADPAAGSYHIEVLTKALKEKSC